MKALEALKRIRQETCPATYNPDFDKEECCNIIEESLKALEIIKEKGVAVGFIQLLEKEHCGGLKEYNDFIGDKKLYLTQEEYVILKEIIQWQKKI